MQTYSLAVIGAGLCGLTIAEKLKEDLPSRILIEKSKSVGGRMATRRDDTCVYDHGAQFYKQAQGRNFYWHDRWLRADKSIVWFKEEEISAIAGKNGMTTLAKDLAQDHQVLLNERVVKIESIENRVNLICSSGKVIHAERVIITCPIPQAIEILKNSMIPYPEDIEKINYVKALVGLFQIEDRKNDLKNFTFQNFPGPIFSVSNNKSKGMGTEIGMTIVMSADFSEKYFDRTDFEIMDLIEEEFLPIMNPSIKIKKRNLKKWRYSHALENHSEDFLPLTANENIILAGDAFGGGSLAGTIRSALAVERHLRKVLNLKPAD